MGNEPKMSRGLVAGWSHLTRRLGGGGRGSGSLEGMVEFYSDVLGFEVVPVAGDAANGSNGEGEEEVVVDDEDSGGGNAGFSTFVPQSHVYRHARRGNLMVYLVYMHCFESGVTIRLLPETRQVDDKDGGWETHSTILHLSTARFNVGHGHWQCART